MSELIKVDGKEYGLEASKAQEIAAMFNPMLKKMIELEKEHNEIVKLEMSPEKCEKAKELRLKFVKVRTGTATIHKGLKQFYLQGGRCVDGWKNAQLMASHGLEEKLKNIEDHFANIEKEKLERIREARTKQLQKYGSDNIISGMLGVMSDEVWANYLSGVKTTHEAKLKAERKAEEDRIENERRKALGQKRKDELNQFWGYVDDTIYQNLDLIDESEYQKYKAEAKKKRDKFYAESEAIKKENERLNQEAIKKEEQARQELIRMTKIANEEKAKVQEETIAREKEIEKQKAFQEHQIAIERKKREDLEKELQIKKEAEQKKLVEEEKHKQINSQKDDTEKYNDFKKEIINVLNKYSFDSEKYHNIKIQINNII